MLLESLFSNKVDLTNGIKWRLEQMNNKGEIIYNWDENAQLDFNYH